MPGLTKRPAPNGPVEKIASNAFCMEPDPNLTDPQKYALHQFLHTFLAAAYALYQIVPPKIANPIIEEKFRSALPHTKPE
jgi:hypothetical protein